MTKTTCFLCAFLIIFACGSKKSQPNIVVHNGRENDMKWFFYAYAYQSQVLFNRSDSLVAFSPTECDISTKDIRYRSDTIICLYTFSKSGYKLRHMTEGLILNGMGYRSDSNVFFPITAMVKLDSFETVNFVRKDNYKTEKEFRGYLERTDTNKISKWLLYEARKRGVWSNP